MATDVEVYFCDPLSLPVRKFWAVVGLAALPPLPQARIASVRLNSVNDWLTGSSRC